MQFSDFSQYLNKLESLSARLDMTAVLAELFQELDASEIPAATNLLQGQLRPAYDSLEFQMSAKMVLKVLDRVRQDSGADQGTVNLFGEVEQTDDTQITQMYKQLGDVGLVAVECVVDSETESSLTIQQVYDTLVVIAEEEGAGSQDRKLVGLSELLTQLDATSAKFVSRMVVGKMRLGFSSMTIIDALSWSVLGNKDHSKQLEAAFQKKADIGQLAQSYITSFRDGKDPAVTLEEYSVEIGIPIIPQLCQRLNTPEEIVAKLGKVYAEPKYDGLRVQIHIDGDTVKAYSRSLEDLTHMFPELEQLKALVESDKVILDAEAIGYDPETDELKLFQETITRKRKHQVAEQAAEVPIRFYVYDVLDLDGKPLLNTPLSERKALLKSLFPESDVVREAPYILTSNAQELQEYHEEQLALGLEGAVVKKHDAPYQSGRKGWYWVKIKEKAGTQGKLTDSIDAVVMGYYFGRGKRTQFGLGAILIGVLNSDESNKDERVLTLAKIGTGMTEDQLVEIKKLCDEWQSTEKPDTYSVAKELLPDVWVVPQIVVEVVADELTISQNHSAGKALRFPRLVRIRTDKTWEQSTTTDELDGIAVAG